VNSVKLYWFCKHAPRAQPHVWKHRTHHVRTKLFLFNCKLDSGSRELARIVYQLCFFAIAAYFRFDKVIGDVAMLCHQLVAEMAVCYRSQI
jgi:hypothetical protein